MLTHFLNQHRIPNVHIWAPNNTRVVLESEELANLVFVISVLSLDPLGRVAHGDDVGSDVGQI
jgi:hypothetical protein